MNRPNTPSIEQVVAINRPSTIARKLAEEHEDFLIETYRDTRKRVRDILRELFPDLPQDHYWVYRSAVQLAIKQVMSEEERVELTRIRRSERLAERISSNPKKHQAQSRQASQARWENGTPFDPLPMLRARGIEPWAPGEREKVFELAANPNYLHVSRTYAGNLIGKKLLIF